MPKGVICGGASEGSNHAGEIVTCQAMTICPAGAPAPNDAAARSPIGAAISDPMTARRDGRWCTKAMNSSSQCHGMFIGSGRAGWPPPPPGVNLGRLGPGSLPFGGFLDDAEIGVLLNVDRGADEPEFLLQIDIPLQRIEIGERLGVAVIILLGKRPAVVERSRAFGDLGEQRHRSEEYMSELQS